MGIDQNTTIGIYIECNGTIGEEHWKLYDILGEKFYYIHSEGHGLPKNKDFWGLNRYSKNVINIVISNESMIFEIDINFVDNVIESFKEEFREEYEKLNSYYKDRGFETEIKFGVVSTFN